MVTLTNYRLAKTFVKSHIPFDALITAAILSADQPALKKLAKAFPEHYTVVTDRVQNPKDFSCIQTGLSTAVKSIVSAEADEQVDVYIKDLKVIETH